MRNSGKPKPSKLKVRRSGIAPMRRESYTIVEAPFRLQPRLRRHHTSKIAIMPPRSGTPDRASLYTTALKGTSTLLLLAITLHLIFSSPLEFLQQNIAQSAASLTVPTSIAKDQVLVTDKNTAHATANDIPAESTTSPVVILSSTDTPSDPNSAEAGSSGFKSTPATEVTASTLLIAETPTANNADTVENLVAPNNATSALTSGSRPTIEAPAHSDGIADVKNHFVKTYRATIFSNLSAQATESRVAHGSEVKALERVNDWVKVEVTASGLNGYIHISHLSIQQ